MEIKYIFNDLPIIETKRLILRKFSFEDIYDIFEYSSDFETVEYVSFYPYLFIDDARNYMRYLIKKYNNGEISPWAVVLKENNKVIGSVEFVNWNTIHNSAEIGYIFNKKYWNKGYGTEVAKKLLEYGFNNMNLNRITARCIDKNIASELILKKIGMRYEGTSFESDYKYFKYRDVKNYAILKCDYDLIKKDD